MRSKVLIALPRISASFKALECPSCIDLVSRSDTAPSTHASVPHLGCTDGHDIASAHKRATLHGARVRSTGPVITSLLDEMDQLRVTRWSEASRHSQCAPPEGSQRLVPCRFRAPAPSRHSCVSHHFTNLQLQVLARQRLGRLYKSFVTGFAANHRTHCQ
jgi:hypothetical protein